MMTPTSLDPMRAWIDTHRPQWIEDYFKFLRFPSISFESKYKADMQECVDWLTQLLTNMHFEVEQWPTAGQPVLFAQNLQAGPTKPTLLIYNHYDVQPVEPLEEWLSPPFQPTLCDGKVYARGAQDNKGQCFYVLQSLKMLQELTGRLPLNIKLCIEGEEEMGSIHLPQILPSHQDQLKADYLAVVDTGLHDAQIPALTLGMRGIITMDVEVQGSFTDLHSGTHGGIVPNPIHALVSLLASLRDDQGRVTIPGFYDDVTEISEAERQLISLHFDAKKYQNQIGAEPVGGEQAYAELERAWTRPTLEINGIHGGHTGNGFKTVIPAKAHAKISCRLVPHQEPEKIAALVVNHLKKHAPAGVKVNVHVHSGNGRAIRVNPQSTVVKGFAQAFEEVFAKPCEFILSGGSVPVIAKLSEVCQGDTLLLGLGLDSDQIHAPNEHFGLDRLEKGILIMARAMQILADHASHEAS